MEIIAAIGGVGMAASLFLNALLGVAALTPTDADDNVLHRVKNLVDKFNGLFGAVFGRRG